MDFKKLIQISDVFGTEAKHLAKLKEGELADRISQQLGWDIEDSQKIENAVDATGNDPADLADIMTDSPAQPQAPEVDTAPRRPTRDGPAVGIDADLPPERPQRPTQDNPPRVGTNTRGDSAADVAADDRARTAPARPTAPTGDSQAARGAAVAADNPAAVGSPDATADIGPVTTTATAAEPAAQGAADAASGDSAADVAQDDAARAQGRDALADRLDTTTPSLLDAYNEGGRRALDSVRDLQTGLSRLGFDPNGIDGKYGRGTYAAVQEFQRQNGLQVDGEAGPATMAKLQELLNSNSSQSQPQGDSAADVAADDAARQTEPSSRAREAGQPDAERDAAERGVQTASKDFKMKNYIKESKDLSECGPEMSMPQNEGNPVTMSVTLNASGEKHVQDLIRMMQLAGAKDAAPVAAMHVGPVDKHDDMVNMMRMMDTPEESVEEEWDNTPEEDYKDHKYMTKDLSGGLNREKKAYAKAQDGDNAMAVESIKEQLLKALQETGYDKS